MGKAKGKERLDKYYHLAKEQGYRSRAAYKLTQLDDKFRFLHHARAVLDLCAAPGGWLQVAVARAPVRAFVVGVDLFPIRPVRGALSLVEDITTPRCRAAVKRAMADAHGGGGCPAFDLVLHDGSPNVGGAWAQEATAQSALVVDALKLATEFLAPKGTFVTKVFRSQDYSAVLYCVKQLFEKVEVTKPVASRSASAEIYVVGLRYKAPGKIDPRLLDVKHLFQGAIVPPKVVDVLGRSKQKRNREGYEDGNTTLRKVGLASDFIWSETPLVFLGSVNVISFNDPSCISIKEHELTTEEVRHLCDDLNVLDKHSFKHLLKWRMRLRKALSSSETGARKVLDEENEIKGDEDEKVLHEMEELANALERKKKRAKKLLAKRRAKDKARKATGMQIDATSESYTDQELFSLSSIKGKKGLVVLDSTEVNDENGDFKDTDDEDTLAEHSPNESDSDEDRRRYDEQLEGLLDEAYERYVTRKGGSIKQKRTKKSPQDDTELLEDGNDDLIPSDPDSDQDLDDVEANPLLVPLHEGDQPMQEQITEKWFSQDVFSEAVEEEVFAESDSEGEAMEKTQNNDAKLQKRSEEKITDDSKLRSEKDISQQEDFEIVPAEAIESSDDSSSSSDESDEDLDDDEKAETLAYAKKMLRKKTREQIIDDAYNKYMFDDEGLPTWFVDDEKRHQQPMKPVTKEEVAAMRAQFKNIDARPAKKVAEAKARKKRVVMRKLEKARQKANSISDQNDISDLSKRKMIEQLYKKAMPKRPQKEFVVAKKGIQVKPGKGKVLVDRRMKKDARVHGAGRQGKGGKKGRGAKGKGKGLKRKGPAGAAGKMSKNKRSRGNKSMND
uniref:Putative rRNA methyltransferase n=1 Tax=Anthurium amnicola TaxID=1678845 RepID=A0A1D1YF76_9ARAE